MTGTGRQAKALSEAQVRAVLHHVESSRYPLRNAVIVLLSFKAGLRAREIALLTWDMVTDASGQVSDALQLTNDASKGQSGRTIPLHPELQKALRTLHADSGHTKSGLVLTFIKGSRDPLQRSLSVQYLFRDWYRALGFSGASSHSGRRSFITRAARVVSKAGGSLRDVQKLAGHSSIAMTQSYIDACPDAQRRLIALL